MTTKITKMKIGIYNRRDNPILPKIEWLITNKFDSYDLFDDLVENEFDDISNREGLNGLIYQGELGAIDAVYVHDIEIFSRITFKVLQVLIEFQKLDIRVYHQYGCIYPSDTALKHFSEQLLEHWRRIRIESQHFDFPGQID